MKTSFYHGDSEINGVFGKSVIAITAMFFNAEVAEDAEENLKNWGKT